MREIKFRAWVFKYNKMFELLCSEIGFDWLGNVSGICLNTIDYPELLGENISFEYNEEKKELELMQYTGLKDKNGKEIYEGDIVCFDGFMTADNSFGIEPNGYIYDEGSVHIIVWNDKLAGWDLNFEEDEEWKYKRDTRCLLIDKSCEIIGNIWQNPELLEVTNENT